MKIGDVVRTTLRQSRFIGRIGRIIDEKYIENKQMFRVKFNVLKDEYWIHEDCLMLVEDYEDYQLNV